MSRVAVDLKSTLPRQILHGLLQLLASGLREMHRFWPPLGDRRFWIVQGLVALVAGVHTGIEAFEVFAQSSHTHVLTFVPTSLFLVPVVYAALNFGFVGSVATAIWCTALTIPNFVFLHAGLDRLGPMIQLSIVDTLAVLVGQRVDREGSARRRAEAAGSALQTSEAKYRGLFVSSPVPVLVLSAEGLVLEANPAAGQLFERTSSSLCGAALENLVGHASAEHLLRTGAGEKSQATSLMIKRGDGSEAHLEPTSVRDSNTKGQRTIQVLLRDVTADRQRHAGLRAYAASVLRAQEEERQRIAQELHDDTVQSLVLLCRRLDAVEGSSNALPVPVIAELREARRIAEEAANGLRNFAGVLRPPTLDDLGLVPSVNRLVIDLAERVPLDGRLKVVGTERRLPPDLELGLFRIAQEALRNVERHAQAVQVLVTITFAAREVKLNVRDDGVGCVLPGGAGDLAASGQLGLLGMQERAALFNGKLGIKSRPGHGTQVTVSVPLE